MAARAAAASRVVIIGRHTEKIDKPIVAVSWNDQRGWDVAFIIGEHAHLVGRIGVTVWRRPIGVRWLIVAECVLFEEKVTVD